MDKSTQKTMFSSASIEWGTPQNFYDRLNNMFQFNLDPCSTKSNSKCVESFSKEEDGLSQSWAGKRVFMNPPYGREIKDWIKKAYEESRNPNTQVVCLIPARTDTKYWHSYCMRASEIYFVKGRLKFENTAEPDAPPCPAPFPSAVVVFRSAPGGLSPAPLTVAVMEASE